MFGFQLVDVSLFCFYFVGLTEFQLQQVAIAHFIANQVHLQDLLVVYDLKWFLSIITRV